MSQVEVQDSYSREDDNVNFFTIALFIYKVNFLSNLIIKIQNKAGKLQ